jgi:hypothetical protein
MDSSYYALTLVQMNSLQPHIQWVPGVKRPGRESDHSPQTNAEVKKT